MRKTAILLLLVGLATESFAAPPKSASQAGRRSAVAKLFRANLARTVKASGTNTGFAHGTVLGLAGAFSAVGVHLVGTDPVLASANIVVSLTLFGEKQFAGLGWSGGRIDRPRAGLAWAARATAKLSVGVATGLDLGFHGISNAISRLRGKPTKTLAERFPHTR